MNDILNNNVVYDNPNIKYYIDYINSELSETVDSCITNINSGIGDILLYKNYCVVKNYDPHIFWNIKHLIDYKPYPDCITNIYFNIKLLYKLFGKSNVTIFYNTNIVKKIPNFIKDIKVFRNLSSYFTQEKIFDKDYVVIHTKLRMRNSDAYIIDNLKSSLSSFFKQFKSKFQIVLLGERKIAQNTATRIIPSITTIYNECTELMKMNDVVDLTEEYLYNTPDMELFERDINIISNAYINIGLGHGGQFCFNLSFSKKTLYYTPPGLLNFEIQNENIIIKNDISSFIDTIKEYLE